MDIEKLKSSHHNLRIEVTVNIRQRTDLEHPFLYRSVSLLLVEGVSKCFSEVHGYEYVRRNGTAYLIAFYLQTAI